MAIALVAKAQAASSDNVTAVTGAINTTGATFLALLLVDYSLTTENTILDSKSNTWAQLTKREDAATSRCRWYYVNSATPTVGSGHTFTADDSGGGASYPTIFVYSFSGTHATPLDSQNGVVNSGSVSSTQFGGGVSPGQAGSLILAGWAWYTQTVTSISIDSGFSTPDVSTTHSSNIPGGASYLIQGAAGLVDPTLSWTTGDNCTASIAAFKPVAGAVTSHAIRTGVLGLERGLSRKILK